MVLESQPRTLETYSMPPCPSLAASMAAYRLRSFSESESWNIRIECSISGLYVMGGRPLRGLDGPCHGYTVRPEDREVIELAVLKDGLEEHPVGEHGRLAAPVPLGPVDQRLHRRPQPVRDHVSHGVCF